MDVYGEDNYSGYSFLCVKNLSCIFSFNSCKVSIGNDISHCEVRQRNNKLNEKTMHRMGEIFANDVTDKLSPKFSNSSYSLISSKQTTP